MTPGMTEALCLIVSLVQGPHSTDARQEYVPCLVQDVQPVKRVLLYTPTSIFMMRKQAKMCGVKPGKFNCKNG